MQSAQMRIVAWRRGLLVVTWLLLVASASIVDRARAASCEVSSPLGQASGHERVIDLASCSRLLRDPAASLKVPQALALFDEKGVVRTHVNLLPTAGAYWLAARIDNRRAQAVLLHLDLGRPHLEEATLWLLPEGGSARSVWRHGPETTFAARAVALRYLGASVVLPPGRSRLVLRYRSRAAGWLDPRLGSVSAVAALHAREDRRSALLNGALAAMVAFAVLMGPLVTWPVSAAFTGYAIAGFAFVFHADGYARQHLWPGLALDEQHASLFFAIVMVASALVFARTLFATRQTQPRADRVYRAVLLALGAAAVLSFALYGQGPFNGLCYALVVATALLHPVIGVLAWRDGWRGSGPFLMGSPLIVGSLAYSALAHLVPGRFSIAATLDFGHWTLVAECFAFAAAALTRALAIRAERDRSLRETVRIERERARTRRALDDAERRYADTRRLADVHRARLDHLRHDIRQPLTGLRAASDGGLGEGAARESLRETLAYLEALAGDRAPDGDRADAAPTAMDSLDADRTVSLAAICSGVSTMFRDEAEAAGLTLHCEVPDLPVPVRSGSIAVMRIVSNLVANAIRHTQQGSVTVRAWQQDRDVILEVADTGQGMAPAELERLRRPGAKGAASEGTGLGLAIVSELAAMHGFDFELSSQPGKGTVARVTLPLARDRIAAPETAAPSEVSVEAAEPSFDA